jgi:hypothetical protein
MDSDEQILVLPDFSATRLSEGGIGNGIARLAITATYVRFSVTIWVWRISPLHRIRSNQKFD